MIKHIIIEISFARDWVQCICGYEGKAYDIIGFQKHKKDNPLSDDLTYEQPYGGKFMKRRVLEEVY